MPSTALTVHCTFDAITGKFLLPVADLPTVDRLGKAKRKRLELWLIVMGRCHLAVHRKATYAALETELANSGLAGFSEGNIKRAFLRFRASGWNWRALVPDYHLTKIEDDAQETTRGSLPAAFLEYWVAHALGYSRGTKAAHADLVARWKAGEEIPGYGTWINWWQEAHRGRPLPAVCPPDLPTGWSYENLQDKLPEQSIQTLSREGFFHAQADLPIMPRDRSQLRALELVAFDDAQMDFRVAVPGLARTSKLRGLFALDVSCGFLVEHGVGPASTDDDSVERSITRADMRGLLFQFLRRTGIPKHYTMWLLVENASAAVTEEDERLLYNISGGRVRILRTAMHTRHLLAGGPTETHGTPWSKGWLESWFNLFHNHASALPAQAGRNPLVAKKGDIEAVERDARQIMKIAQGLPPALMNLVQLPALRVDQARTVVADLIARLNHRDDHRLQGFAPMPMWRLRVGEQWEPLTTLPAQFRDVAMIDHQVESPAQRFARLLGESEFERLPESSLLPLLDDKKTVTVVRPYQIEFQWQGVKKFFQLDDERLLRVGATFTACFDRQAMDCIHLLDDEGGYVGTAHLWVGANPVNKDEIAKTTATVKALQNRLIKRAQDLSTPRAAANLTRLEAGTEELAGEIAGMEAARLAGGQMAAATESHRQAAASTRAASTKRTAKKRAAVNSTLASLADEAAQFGV